MAIAHRGTSTYHNSAVTTTSHSIPYPSGGGAPQAGDIIIMALGSRVVNNAANTPAGWNVILKTTASTSKNCSSFWKLATGSEGGTSQTVTFPSAGEVQGGMVAYSGVNSTTPLDVSAIGQDQAAAAPHTTQALTVATADTEVIYLWVSGSADVTWGTVAGCTERFEAIASGTDRPILYVDKPGPSTAGASSGTATSTSSGTPTAIVQTIALRPQAPTFAGNTRGVLYNQSTLVTAAPPAELRYDLRSLSQKSAGLTYDVKRLASASRQALYNVAFLTTQSRQALYNILGRATQSRILAHDVRAIASSAGATLSYDVLVAQLMAGTLGAPSFDVRALATAGARQMRFDIYTRTTQARTLTFDLRTLAGKGYPALWDVRAYAAKLDTNEVRYDVSGRATNLRALTFDARGLSSQNALVRFDISGRAGSASPQGVLGFDLRALAGALRTGTHDVRALASASPKSLLYNVLISGPLSSRALSFSINGLAGPPQRIIGYDILQTAGIVGGQRVLLFNIRDFAEVLGSALYNVSSRASQNRALAYSIMVRASQATAISYEVRGLAGAGRTTLYDLLAHAILVSAARDLGYDIKGLAATNRALSYNLRSLSGASGTLYFNTHSYSAGIKEIRYDVRGLSQVIGRVVRFDVTIPVGIQRTIHYDLGGYLVVSRSILFRVERLGAEFMVLVEGEVVPASAILDESLWPVTLLEERMEAGAVLAGIEMEAATELGHKRLIVPTRLEEDISPGDL